jgi:hypothetical protein
MSEPHTYTVEEYETITRYMSEDMDHMKKTIDLLLQQVDVLNARIELLRE